MNIHFGCPECGYLIFAPESSAGRTTRCPSCAAPIQVPEQSDAEYTGNTSSYADPIALPCPACESPLRLIPALRGRHICCNACRAVLTVDSDSWHLAIVGKARQGRQPNRRQNTTAVPPNGETGKNGAAGKNGSAGSNGASRRTGENGAAANSGTTKSSQTIGGTNGAATATLPSTSGAARQPAALAARSKTKKRPTEASVPSVSSVVRPKLLGASLAGVGLLVVVAVVWVVFFMPSSFTPADFVEKGKVAAYASLDVTRWRQRSQQPGFPEDEALQPTHLARYRTFLANAGIAWEDVTRISSASDARDPQEVVVVYELNRPLEPSEVTKRSAFQRLGNEKQQQQEIAGVLLCSIGPVGICFPDPQIVVTGRKQQLERLLKRRGDEPDEVMPQLCDSLDPTVDEVSAMVGVPLNLQKTFLADCPELVQHITGSTREVNCGAQWRLTRKLWVEDAGSAERLRDELERRFREASRDKQRPDEVRLLLKSLQVQCFDTVVDVRVGVDETMLHGEMAATIEQIF